MLRQFILWVAALMILTLFFLLLIRTATGVLSRWPGGFQFFSLAVPMGGVSALVWLATHVRRR